MMFNPVYYTPMDRGYEITIPTDDMPTVSTESAGVSEEGFGVKDVGMSVPLGISAANVQGVQAKIRAGVGNIELGFPGAVHGGRQAHTPEMYGTDQRMALDEVRRVSEVKMTTHAAYNVMGLTGVDQQGNFSWMYRKMAVDEIRRAIDFAADTAGGGSVVVHTGEFERPLSEQSWSRDENDRLIFRKYIHEPVDAQFKVIDNRTGQVMTAVQKDRLVARAVWNRAKEDCEGNDQDGNRCFIHKGDYIDYEGRKLIDPYDIRRGRVPAYDPETGRFKVEMWHFDDFIKEAEERNRLNEQKIGRKLSPQEIMLPEEAYLQATLETQEGHSRGWALVYGERFEDSLNAIEKLKKVKEYYEQLDKNLPEEEKWKIMMQDQAMYHLTGGLIQPETKHPMEMIENKMKDLQRNIEYAREASLSMEQQANDTAETRRHIKSQIKRMWSAGTLSYAEAGIHAMERTKDQKNPVMITMENIFPDRYGGHPEELKELIKLSRERMVGLLTEPKRIEEEWDVKKKEYVPTPHENPYYKGISKEEAQKLAEQHIKATIDTGHFNLWRKYYLDDPSKTKEQNDAEFKKWLVKEVEDLAKNKMIGNVHLTDNFGYQDDHLAPGQGTTPVKEIMAVLKKYGYDKALTVEPGADASTDLSDFHGLMKAWRHFGSSVYSVGGGPVRAGAPNRNWTDVQYSYFGQTYPPYFIFGAYSPSNDWTLWSAVPME